MELKKTNLNLISELRKQYLNSLYEFQDIYLEFIVEQSDCYLLENYNDRIGYVIISEDNALIELFVIGMFSHDSVKYFNQIVKDLNIHSVLCKSYDSLLMNCCLSNNMTYKLIGCLYRDFVDRGINKSMELNFRYAGDSDMPFLLSQEDEVFEPKEFLKRFVDNKSILVFEDFEDIVGCGFLTRVNEDFDYYDLGVWIDEKYRRKGYATQIMLQMIDLCNIKNLKPICGCDIDNAASRGMLNKLGFYSKHKLIEFS